MKDSWICIKTMAIPIGLRGLRVLLWTPGSEHIEESYRVCDATDSHKLRDATHWQPMLNPKGKGTGL